MSAPQPPLPKDWIAATDKKTGKLYYYHKVTRETTWVRPLPEVGGETKIDSNKQVKRTLLRGGITPRSKLLQSKKMKSEAEQFVATSSSDQIRKRIEQLKAKVKKQNVQSKRANQELVRTIRATAQESLQLVKREGNNAKKLRSKVNAVEIKFAKTQQMWLRKLREMQQILLKKHQVQLSRLANADSHIYAQKPQLQLQQTQAFQTPMQANLRQHLITVKAALDVSHLIDSGNTEKLKQLREEGRKQRLKTIANEESDSAKYRKLLYDRATKNQKSDTLKKKDSDTSHELHEPLHFRNLPDRDDIQNIAPDSKSFEFQPLLYSIERGQDIEKNISSAKKELSWEVTERNLEEFAKKTKEKLSNITDPTEKEKVDYRAVIIEGEVDKRHLSRLWHTRHLSLHAGVMVIEAKPKKILKLIKTRSHKHEYHVKWCSAKLARHAEGKKKGELYDGGRVFVLSTGEDGKHILVLRVKTPEQAEVWVEQINLARVAELERLARKAVPQKKKIFDAMPDTGNLEKLQNRVKESKKTLELAVKDCNAERAEMLLKLRALSAKALDTIGSKHFNVPDDESKTEKVIPQYVVNDNIYIHHDTHDKFLSATITKVDDDGWFHCRVSNGGKKYKVYGVDYGTKWIFPEKVNDKILVHHDVHGKFVAATITKVKDDSWFQCTIDEGGKLYNVHTEDFGRKWIYPEEKVKRRTKYDNNVSTNRHIRVLPNTTDISVLGVLGEHHKLYKTKRSRLQHGMRVLNKVHEYMNDKDHFREEHWNYINKLLGYDLGSPSNSPTNSPRYSDRHSPRAFRVPLARKDLRLDPSDEQFIEWMGRLRKSEALLDVKLYGVKSMILIVSLMQLAPSLEFWQKRRRYQHEIFAELQQLNGSGSAPSEWNVDEIVSWVRYTLLEPQCADAFKTEDVDGITLLQLDEETFAELGINDSRVCKKVMRRFANIENLYREKLKKKEREKAKEKRSRERKAHKKHHHRSRVSDLIKRFTKKDDSSNSSDTEDEHDERKIENTKKTEKIIPEYAVNDNILVHHDVHDKFLAATITKVNDNWFQCTINDGGKLYNVHEEDYRTKWIFPEKVNDKILVHHDIHDKFVAATITKVKDSWFQCTIDEGGKLYNVHTEDFGRKWIYPEKTVLLPETLKVKQKHHSVQFTLFVSRSLANLVADGIDCLGKLNPRQRTAAFTRLRQAALLLLAQLEKCAERRRSMDLKVSSHKVGPYATVVQLHQRVQQLEGLVKHGPALEKDMGLAWGPKLKEKEGEEDHPGDALADLQENYDELQKSYKEMKAKLDAQKMKRRASMNALQAKLDAANEVADAAILANKDSAIELKQNAERIEEMKEELEKRHEIADRIGEQAIGVVKAKGELAQDMLHNGSREAPSKDLQSKGQFLCWRTQLWWYCEHRLAAMGMMRNLLLVAKTRRRRRILFKVQVLGLFKRIANVRRQRSRAKKVLSLGIIPALLRRRSQSQLMLKMWILGSTGSLINKRNELHVGVTLGLCGALEYLQEERDRFGSSRKRGRGSSSKLKRTKTKYGIVVPKTKVRIGHSIADEGLWKMMTHLKETLSTGVNTDEGEIHFNRDKNGSIIKKKDHTADELVYDVFDDFENVFTSRPIPKHKKKKKKHGLEGQKFKFELSKMTAQFSTKISVSSKKIEKSFPNFDDLFKAVGVFDVAKVSDEDITMVNNLFGPDGDGADLKTCISECFHILSVIRDHAAGVHKEEKGDTGRPIRKGRAGEVDKIEELLRQRREKRSGSKKKQTIKKAVCLFKSLADVKNMKEYIARVIAHPAIDIDKSAKFLCNLMASLDPEDKLVNPSERLPIFHEKISLMMSCYEMPRMVKDIGDKLATLRKVTEEVLTSKNLQEFLCVVCKLVNSMKKCKKEMPLNAIDVSEFDLVFFQSLTQHPYNEKKPLCYYAIHKISHAPKLEHILNFPRELPNLEEMCKIGFHVSLDLLFRQLKSAIDTAKAQFKVFSKHGDESWKVHLEGIVKDMETHRKDLIEERKKIDLTYTKLCIYFSYNSHLCQKTGAPKKPSHYEDIFIILLQFVQHFTRLKEKHTHDETVAKRAAQAKKDAENKAKRKARRAERMARKKMNKHAEIEQDEKESKILLTGGKEFGSDSGEDDSKHQLSSMERADILLQLYIQERNKVPRGPKLLMLFGRKKSPGTSVTVSDLQEAIDRYKRKAKKDSDSD